jgi:2-polyprenyl-3-methyl-5-hydroxy-6-metoxy-1,4-benzoquinol methylase
LEIGCGWGSLAKVVKDKIGCSMKVIEPSLLASRVAREYYKLDVFSGDFDEYIKQVGEKQKFDFVYSRHVFEHIFNPNNFLQSVRNILKANGKLLLTLPNIRRPDVSSEIFYHIEHPFYYSPNTLILMLKKYGFEMVKIWQNKRDMTVIFEKSEAGDVNYVNNEINKVVRKRKYVDVKYKFLRKVKKIIFYFFSTNRKDKINSLIMKIIK